MTNRWKINISLFFMVAILIVSQVAELKSIIFYDNGFLNSQAQASATDKDENDIIQKGTDEALHFTIVEIIKIIVLYIAFPVITLVYVLVKFKVKRAEERIEWIKRKIEDAITRYEFNKIFEKGKQKHLNEQYIRNAFRTARLTNNPIDKKMAIQQLTQFHEDSAINGLIELLKEEKDITFKYIIIHALYKVVKNREKNNV